ncbi:MAG: DNA-protecting protein DprA [Nitrospirae bacterium]|nr:DNA-protecting protein DprA [Nitrospirota bacterium]
MNNLKYWVALSELEDIGPVLSKKLLSIFKTPERIFKAEMSDLLSVEGIGINRARNIKGFPNWKNVDKHLKVLEERDIKVVDIDSPSYPEMLKQIEDAPVVLYVKGEIKKEDRYAIAIIGSRKPTPYGISVAENISEELASMGFTIVSGMARGIDAISHKGALRAGGRTIAVLGSGIDIPYPAENKCMMDKIVTSGYIVSEFPPGTPPDKENFPRRNRIISGLSFGVLVIEATSDSGSLITAGYALEQGREVFAIPGNITSPASAGTNELLKKGAILTRYAEDIISELAPVLKGFIRSRQKDKIEITDEEKKVCNYLTGEPKHIDNISRESGLPTSKVLEILLRLELKGLIRQITGNRFYLT